MIITPFSALSPLVLTPADLTFHGWCSDVGIRINRSTKVVTTPQSVAGRGVFALEDLEQGEIIAHIPNGVIFHPDNCSGCFPNVADKISKCKAQAGIVQDEKRKFRWIHSLWRKVVREKNPEYYQMDVEELWQPELTLYALEALKEGHPWSEWISQWQRDGDDPTYRLFMSNARSCDKEAISSTADELQNAVPYLSHVLLRAALSMQLLKLEEEREVLPLNDDSETSAMYSLLGSRVGDLYEGTSGVIPFHDMINHSLLPNLSMDHDSEFIDIYANHPIKKGQELFLCYTNLDKPMTATCALWSLVQWGIPTPAAMLDNDAETE